MKTVTVVFFDVDPDNGNRYVESLMNMGDDFPATSDAEYIKIARKYSSERVTDDAEVVRR